MRYSVFAFILGFKLCCCRNGIGKSTLLHALARHDILGVDPDTTITCVEQGKKETVYIWVYGYLCISFRFYVCSCGKPLLVRIFWWRAALFGSFVICCSGVVLIIGFVVLFRLFLAVTLLLCGVVLITYLRCCHSSRLLLAYLCAWMCIRVVVSFVHLQTGFSLRKF